MIRTATSEDLPLVERLFRAFNAEIPDAAWRDDDTDEDRGASSSRRSPRTSCCSPTTSALPRVEDGRALGFLDILYVAPAARGTGVAAELAREAASALRDRGAECSSSRCSQSNERARAVYERWGFAPVELTLAAPIDALVGGSTPRQRADVRLGPRPDRRRRARSSAPCRRCCRGSDGRSARRSPVPTTAGSPCTTSSATATRRRCCSLAKELSYANGGVVLALGVEEGAVVRYTLFDRGSIVDEYASVPEYHGPLPPGDVIALGANPTVVARLTGADPARVREIARTASSPADLPPALELHAQIAELMGVRV